MQLAGYANADGTSIRPSTKTLADQTGFSRRKVCRLLDDLKVLGLCEKVGRYGQRGAAIRRLLLPENPSSRPLETPSLRVPDSISESAGFDLRVPDSILRVPHWISECHSCGAQPAIQTCQPTCHPTCHFGRCWKDGGFIRGSEGISYLKD